jgi:mono/diheme cytochrome c family protein
MVKFLAKSVLVISIGAIFLSANANEVANDRLAQIERGRYLTKITQCNNCHTDGYSASGGTVPESRWLDGTARSWITREGTVWATNLRLLVHEIPVDTWIHLARSSRARSPMPWWSLRDMSEEDLRAVYAFIHSLGPSGRKAPAFIPADPSKPPPATPVHD